jgi:hypothetical protein
MESRIARKYRMESRIARKYRMLITDQVATAPCTDPIQVRFPTFGAKPIAILL